MEEEKHFSSKLNVKQQKLTLKKQILLDWVNTIDEPRCMVLGNLEALRDGTILLRIANALLRKAKMETEWKIDWDAVEMANQKQRFMKAVEIFRKFDSENRFWDNNLLCENVEKVAKKN